MRWFSAVFIIGLFVLSADVCCHCTSSDHLPPCFYYYYYYYYYAIYRRANLDVSLLRNDSRLDWLPNAACGVSTALSVAPPTVPADRRPGICPWNVRRLEMPRGNFVPTVGETAECLDEPEASLGLFRHMTILYTVHCARSSATAEELCDTLR